MPKNKGRNAFFFFMADWKRRAEAQGQTFPNGFKDVQADPDCNQEWQSMTKQQKGPYEAMAKEDKIASQVSSPQKKTTYGESISDLEKEEEEERKFLADMHEYLKLTVTRALNHNIVPQLKFCFIHVNWFFTKIVKNTLEYFPAEYSVGVFSLENGIEDVHHVIVGAQIPLGYRREALETSQSTHNIPVENPNGEMDFAVMYEKLINFLESRKIVHKYPPLFTTKALKPAVKSLLGRLSEAAAEDKGQFLVYEIEALFQSLAREAYKNRPDREVKYIAIYADYVFTQVQKYSYKRGYECSFHKYVDGGSVYCSTSMLHQWTWLMCDELCKWLEVDMKEGVHYPKELDFTFDALAESMANLDIKRNICSSKPEHSTVVSMTGVSEQHRLRVSERTYEDEMRRRTQYKPIVVVQCESKICPTNKDVDESDEPVNKSIKEPTRNCLTERQMRTPNTTSYAMAAANVDDYILKSDEKSFPPIGGRGVLCKTKSEVKKPPLGKGQGFA